MKRYIRPVVKTPEMLKNEKNLVKAKELYSKKINTIMRRDGQSWTDKNCFELGWFADELEERFKMSGLALQLINCPVLNEEV